MQNPSISAEIAQLEAERIERTQIRADAVLREVNAVALAKLPPELMSINAAGEVVINLSKQLTKEQLSALAIKLESERIAHAPPRPAN